MSMDSAPMYHAPMNPALGPLFGPVIGQAFTCVYNSFFMSKAEKERLQLSREEYETSIKFHYEKMELEREKLRDDIKRMEMQINADREQQREGHRLQNWPLGISALAILDASQSTRGRALNVIVCVVPNQGEEDASITRMVDLLLKQPCKVAASAAGKFIDSGIRFYSDRARTWIGEGDNLPATIYGLLKTEPTVLIEIRIPAPDQITFQTSCWGVGFDDTPDTVDPWVKGNRIPVDMVPLPSTESPDYTIHEEERKYQLALYLASMVVGMGDLFRTLQHGYRLPALVLPSMISDPTFGERFLGIDQANPSFDWQYLITKYYLDAYDRVAELNKLIASELAAKAALSFHTADQNGTAELFLRKAIEITGILLNSNAFRRLLSRRPELKRALSIVGLPEWESARNAREENKLTLQESANRDKEDFRKSMRSQHT
jgi:hypothetical protein